MYKNIRDYVPNNDKYLPDLELVDKYIECFLGTNSDILDLRCLNFSLSSRGSGSAGTLCKANTENWFFKLSQFSEYEPDEYGYESVCEVIGTRLANLLEFDNAGYAICHAVISIGSRDYVTYLCVSSNYKEANEHRTTLENLLKLKEVSTLSQIENFECCKSESYFDDLCKMLLFDFIIDNRDRHGANIELLISDSIRLAPIYDTGYSLLSPLGYDIEKINKFNPLHNGPVNNFLISYYWEDVLHHLKGYIKIPKVNWDNFYIDDLINCFKHDGEFIIRCMRSMIIGRYKYAEKILNS